MLSDLVLSLELEEPDAALPEVLGELAPPLAWSFFVSLDMEPEPEAAPEVELDGDEGEVDGEVVEPDEDEAEPDGDVVDPDGEVVVLREEALSARSHAAIIAVPNATDTASARVLNLM